MPRQDRPVFETLPLDEPGQPEQASLGEQVIDEQADDDQRDGIARIEPAQQRDGHHQQSHLTNGRIAQ